MSEGSFEHRKLSNRSRNEAVSDQLWQAYNALKAARENNGTHKDELEAKIVDLEDALLAFKELPSKDGILGLDEMYEYYVKSCESTGTGKNAHEPHPDLQFNDRAVPLNH